MVTLYSATTLLRAVPMGTPSIHSYKTCQQPHRPPCRATFYGRFTVMCSFCMTGVDEQWKILVCKLASENDMQ